MERTIITTSWDDGHPLDLKLARLLKEYDIPATFYIPIKNPGRKVLKKKYIQELSKHFDMGGHTYSHANLEELDQKRAYREITRGKKRLEKIIGKTVKPFCYPKGKYNKNTVNLVKKAGFIGARSVRNLEYKPDFKYSIGTTIHVGKNGLTQLFSFLKKSKKMKNTPLFLYLLSKKAYTKNWLKLACYSLEFVLEKGGIFHLWGHSWKNLELENNWRELEVFLKIVRKKSSEREDILLVNNSELLELLE